MIEPARQWCIHIEVTNACDRSCANCTRLTAHVRKPFFMTRALYEKAIAVLSDFPSESTPDAHGRPKVIGMMGGEPTMHPRFLELCRIVERRIPDPAARGLWTNLGRKYHKHRKMIDRVFGCQNLNPHSGETRHQPVLVAIRDVVDDPQERDRLIRKCWLQEEWSSAITPRGMYFCEVAAALDSVLELGVGGLPIEPGCWRRPLSEYSEQIQTICQHCGIAVPLRGRLDTERRDDVSVSNLERLKELGSPRVLAEHYVEYEAGSLALDGDPWRPARYARDRSARMIRAPKKTPGSPGIRRVKATAPAASSGGEREGPPAVSAVVKEAADPLLSICIPSLASRAESLGELLKVFAPQLQEAGSRAEISIAVDGGGTLPARKRNELLFSARGRFVCFVDDDDMVAEDYIPAILEEIERDPLVDVVSFEGERSVDGGDPHRMIWSAQTRKNSRDPDGTRHIAANHLCPIRREIARRSFFFSRTRYGCDQLYWKLISAAGLLEREAHIKKPLYFYRFSWSGTSTQQPSEQEATRQAGIAYRPYRLLRSIAGAGLEPGDLVIAANGLASENGTLAIQDRTWAIRTVAEGDLDPLEPFEITIGRPGRYELPRIHAR